MGKATQRSVAGLVEAQNSAHTQYKGHRYQWNTHNRGREHKGVPFVTAACYVFQWWIGLVNSSKLSAPRRARDHVAPCVGELPA